MTATQNPPLKRIDEPRLEQDLAYRYGYLSEFIGFGADDIAAIHATVPHLAPLVPALVDVVYEKLFSYDATKRHFVARQHGYEGPLPESLEKLGLDHEQIRFRKNHLGTYLKRLVTGTYDASMVSYLDHVGAIHTPKAGSPTLNVPLVQMNALMGFVSDALLTTVAGLPLAEPERLRTLRAFNKLLWIQNDLIVRHYATTA
jgi:hypothetical protein